MERVCLVLDNGDNLGFVEGMDGGFIKAELAHHPLGPDGIQRKYVAGISYEPFTIEAGMGMAPEFYEWITASFRDGYATRTGEFIACDLDYKAVRSREFVNAHIAGLTIPDLDASSREPAYMTIEIDPSLINYKPGYGGQVSSKTGAATTLWSASRFKVEIGDLPTSRVARVGAFTWKQQVNKNEVGQFQFRRTEASLTTVEVPNIKLTMSMADFDAWEDWHRRFIIEGQCSESDELLGAIRFLSRDFTKELASIDLLHIGLISLEADHAAAGHDVARFSVEMYVEEMRFNYSA
jgi:hypothetical protein